MSPRRLREGLSAFALAAVLGVAWPADAINARCANAITADPTLNQTTTNWGLPTAPLFDGAISSNDEVRVRVDRTTKVIYIGFTVNPHFDINNMVSPLPIWVGIGNGNTLTSNGAVFKLDILSNTGTPPASNNEHDAISGSTANGTMQVASITSGTTFSAYTTVGDTDYLDAGGGTKGAYLNVLPSTLCGGGIPDARCGIYNVELAVPTHVGTPLIDANGGIQVDSLDNFSFWAQVTEPVVTFGSRAGWPTSIDNYGGTTHYAGDTNVVGIDAWQLMATASAANAECSINGSITLNADTIGRFDSTSPNFFATTMETFDPNISPLTSEPLVTNQIISADVFNGTNADIASGDLVVSFQIANWGSQVPSGAGGWVPLNMKGQNIIFAGPGNTNKQYETATALVDGNGVGSSNGFPSAHAAFTLSKGNIDTAQIMWSPAMSYACQFHDDSSTLYKDIFTGAAQCPTVNPQALLPTTAGTDSLQSHQCLFVTAHSNAAAFPDVSVWRNMDFVHASHFQRDAVLDTTGLPRVSRNSRGHFIYLYLETRNMADDLSEGQTFPFPSPGGDIGGPILFDSIFPDPTNAPPPGSLGDWRDSFPTYIVHVYAETGQSVRSSGPHPRTRQLLRQMSSFGYYVGHDGTPIFGWIPGLSGAQLIAPNFYRIFIPNDGQAIVTTTVDSKEVACKTGIDCICKMHPDDPRCKCVDFHDNGNHKDHGHHYGKLKHCDEHHMHHLQH